MNYREEDQIGMQSIKQVLKSIENPTISRSLRRANSQLTAIRVNRFDSRRFSASRMRNLRGASKTQIDAKLTFHAHSIEKGLSHANMRVGFGSTALANLAATMREHNRQGLRKSDLSYQNALATLKAYVEAHEGMGEDYGQLKSILGDLFDEVTVSASDLGGVLEVTRDSKLKNREKTFRELFAQRSSVREFAPDGLDVDRVYAAIDASTKAPSVCNRQASFVHIVRDKDKIAKILAIQGGMVGYAMPPALLVVTTDMRAFFAPTERNQAFIDGGLFAMALMLALESEQIAACPLNAMLTVKNERKISDLVGLQASDCFILFLAVGEFPERVKVPKSFRVPASAITQLV